ncbi:hypothetical protein Pint_31483 [Pistacia integerrima]|uniref:Uncharacterized protein n=1 Tax=Pistacia integerrima TaxID=434235 RepID=A0ACC0XS35_9ROSI|nr:hypothetical protein Pint_31483 [Pistacia integerrima]
MVASVDCIRWVRHDCIILGCFQLTEDGKEENYLVQVIRSKDGKITDAASKPVVLSFCGLFADLIDDIVPFGNGPYLFLSYLKQCELAITANRKNTDQHIVLLGWSLGDEETDVAVVDINRDKWLPRIELQDNDDDNLIMGLCIDKASLYGKVKVQLGVEEEKELSPYCILMCLTLEGKLNMFHVASCSLSGTTASPGVVSTLSDEEEGTPDVVTGECELPKLSSGSGEQNKAVAISSQLQDWYLKEGGREISAKNSLRQFGNYESSISSPANQISHKDTTSGNRDLEGTAGQQVQLSVQQSTNLGQSSSEVSHQEEPRYAVQNSNKTETQNIAGFGSEFSAFAGKVPTDVPSISNQKDVPKSFELGKELLGKTGSAALQSATSQSWSSGKNIFVNESDVKSPVIPSSHIQGKSSENFGTSVGAANVSGGFAGKPFPWKDASGTSSSVNFSTRPVQGDGLRTSTEMGKIELLPSIRSLQSSTQTNFASGKSHNNKLYPSRDDYKAAVSGMPNSEPNLSKQSGNLKEMTKELDALLQSIEERGGFRDACTISQMSKVQELEQGIGTLSEKCRMWRSIMDERLEEIQNLLDKTVQVLARKIYMEGVVKQASDCRYWDLWNHQKLSPELELKRRQILQLNQDLTNQLIELEQHFNTLELNKFGENDGLHVGRRAPQSKVGLSRCIQSLHSLHTTMSSQLAAAELLSERLSKQMGVLTIESPMKQQNVKKELFETIGIPYDASFSSPDAKVTDPSSMKKLLLSSGSAATKDHSRRRQSSAMKSYDPETARRRRDSLDRSWASFEPPKTTVKRMLLQEHQKASPNKLSLSDKKYVSPHMSDGAAIVRPKDRATPSSSLYLSENKGIQETSLKQASENQSTLFRWANDPVGPSQSTGPKFPAFQSNTAAISSHSALQLPLMGGQNHARYDITADKSSHVDKSNSVLIGETRPILQSETSVNQEPSTRTVLPTFAPSLSKKTSETPNSNSKGSVSANSTIESEKTLLTTTKIVTIESGKNRDAQLSISAAIPTASALPGKVAQFDVATKSKPGEKVSTSPAFSMSPALLSPMFNFSNASPSTLSTLSSTSSSSAMSFGESLTTSKASIDVKPIVSSISMSLPSTLPIASPSSVSASSFTTFSSSSFFSVQAPKTPVSLSNTPAVSLTSKSPKTEPQLSTDKLISKTEGNATIQTKPVQPGSPVAGFGSKLETSVSSTSAVEAPTSVSSTSAVETPTSVPSASAVETPTSLASGSKPSFTNMAGNVFSVLSNAQREESSTANTLFSSPIPTSASTTGGKNESLDIAVSQEDEMEEEAPETSQTTELSLGSLGGFGIGSTPNPSAPKPNPFGGLFGNAATSPVSSPFTVSVPSGRLFRPASFSFESPQSSQPSQPTAFSSFSGGFGTTATPQASAQTGFGQPAQIGSGQQALGSVLGSFGQSRQIGAGLPGAGFASASSFGGGFAAPSPTGGFSSSATGGGFAAVASGSGGFANLASGGGGFSGVASGGGFGGMAPASGGFAAAAPAGGGFAAAASGGGGFAVAGGGGFGAFGSQQGSAFGGGAGGTGKPPELFSQMRK